MAPRPAPRGRRFPPLPTVLRPSDTTSRVFNPEESKDCNGITTGTGMVRRGGDAARVKALLPTYAAHCWHLLCWWRTCILGALPPSLWSKDNGSKESQVGIMRSNLYKLDFSPACAALQPGVRTAEHSSL